MTETTIIIGAGQAGIQTAASLRSGGYDGRIIMISDETDPPYQKPPLSKGYLMGVQKEENLYFRAAGYYEDKKIELMLGERVENIDPANNSIHLTSGVQLSYTNLVLSTGARNRMLKLPGADLEGIYYLRNMQDGKSLKSELENVKTIAVVGGGFIGLEIAAAAREAGISVTVIEVLDRLMARVLPPVISDVFESKHTEKGIDLLFNSKAVEFSCAEGKVTGVILEDGRHIEADIVVVGIGVIPNQELADAAGIECSNGINVDEFTRTSVANIYSNGDCASHYNPFVDKVVRLESVQNAVDQGKTTAANIMNETMEYHFVPWFWTHQFELKLQMAGCNIGFTDYVIRGDVDEHKFSVYYFKEDQLIGVDSMNRAPDHLSARKLIQAGISPSREQAADMDFKLKELLKK